MGRGVVARDIEGRDDKVESGRIGPDRIVNERRSSDRGRKEI